jgi:hypothetical protein
MKCPWLLQPTLFAPADDYTGGSGGNTDIDDDDDDDNGAIDDDDDDLDDDDDDAGAKVGGFDASALSRGIVEGLSPLLRQPQQQMSQEDAIRHLRVPVDVQLISLMRDPETPPAQAQAAMQQLMDNMMQRSLQLSGQAVKSEFSQFTPQLQALQQAHQEQQITSLVTETMRKFPALKGKAQVVRRALNELGQQGISPRSKTEAMKLLAKQAGRTIRQIDPNFSLKTQKSSNFVAPRSGGGGGRPQTGGKPGWQNLFG